MWEREGGGGEREGGGGGEREERGGGTKERVGGRIECCYISHSLSPVESTSSGPRLLWSLYYNVTLHSVDQSLTSTLEFPRGLYVTSEPDDTIGYEKAANEV